MLKSMTGFGKGIIRQDGRELTVELKSVNHKFLDLSFKTHRSLSFLEDCIRTTIFNRLSRGHIDISITYKNTRDDTKTILVNEALTDKYIELGKKLSVKYDIRNDMSVMNILRLPEVITIDEAQDDIELIQKMAVEATNLALCELISMREKEGERLKKDFLIKITEIEKLRSTLVSLADGVTAENAKKLAARIEKLMPEGIVVDEARLAAEIAILADKACVDEELVRINTHLENLKAMLELDEPIGRKADFLIQELNREFNTTGSKSTDSAISSIVIRGKAEIEKLREQIQNIE